MAKALNEISGNLNQAWQNVAEGWRALVSRCNSAVTQFIPQKNGIKQENVRSTAFPRWSVLAGEVIDRDKSVVVQVKLPGIPREDCDISVHKRTLRIRGEKRMDREHIGGSYYVMERAYGFFERVIPLPVRRRRRFDAGYPSRWRIASRVDEETFLFSAPDYGEVRALRS